MQVAFILKLDLPNTNDLGAVAEHITDTVGDELQVISCVPWSRNDLDPSTISMSQPNMEVPEPQTQGPMDLTSFGS